MRGTKVVKQWTIALCISFLCQIAVADSSEAALHLNQTSLQELLAELDNGRIKANLSNDAVPRLEPYLSSIEQYPAELRSHFYLLLMYGYTRTGRQIRSNEIYQQLSQLESQGHVSLEFQAFARFLRGVSLSYQGDDSADQWLREAKKRSEVLGYHYISFLSNLVLGDNRAGLGKPSQALQHYQTAKDIFTQKLWAKSSEKERLSQQGEISYRIAMVYGSMAWHKEALSYLKQAYDQDSQAGNEHSVRFDLYSIARCFDDLQDYDQSEVYYKKLLKRIVDQNYPDPERAFSAYVGLMRLSLKQNHIEKATGYMNLAERDLSSLESAILLTTYRLEKSRLYLMQKKFDQALSELDRIDKTSNARFWGTNGYDILEIKAKILTGLEKHPQAIAAYQELYQYHRKRNNNLKVLSAEVERTHFDFEMQQMQKNILLRDKEITELKLRTAKQQAESNEHKMLLTLAVALFLAASCVILIYLRQKLRKLANTDALTGLLNRRVIFEQGQRLRGSGKDFSVLLVDIDHFKQVNDRYGHSFGDEVLKQIATLGETMAKQKGCFSRLGGEEFLFLLENISVQEAYAFARKFNQGVREIKLDQDLTITTSIGIATCKNQEDFDQLLERADQAMYKAKENGRNREYVSEQFSVVGQHPA